MRKKISILGSTGSIGKNALHIASQHKEKIEVVAIAARQNIDLLEKQALEHQPKLVAVFDEDQAMRLQQRLPNIPVLGGVEGLCAVAAYDSADTVVAAIVGSIGLIPTIEAIKAKKTIALANKEVLVAAGECIVPLAKAHGVSLIPVDSEHSAIFQCIDGEDRAAISRILLTSSGGPFREWTTERLRHITVEDALKHPNFSMGAKITIDSSTMMNKGLEIIEAYWLFGLSIKQIEVIVHPQQKIHGIVEFNDGSILAQMCEPDMIIPIQYAMTYPERCRGLLKPYDFINNNRLDFYQPDTTRFRCLDLAYHAIRTGGSLPCYMNAANETLVHRFLSREISWFDIGEKLESLMMRHDIACTPTLEELLNIDREARGQAQSA